MLERLYVDNYKCLVNFEFKPGPFSLLMGANGTGKSAVGEILTGLKKFAHDGEVTGLLSAETRNVWVKNQRQRIELTATVDGASYEYSIEVEPYFDPDRRIQTSRTKAEWLSCNGVRQFEFHEGRLTVVRAGKQASLDFQFNWYKSALAFFHPRPENELIMPFKRWLNSCVYVQFLPGFEASTPAESTEPGERLESFVSWLRFALQTDPSLYSEAWEKLREAVDGFEGFRLEGDQNLRTLVVEFSAGSEKQAIPVDRLSHGQQMLLALYTLTPVLVKGGRLVVFDEPDNFVAIREIQPWLLELQDRQKEHGAQVLLISHHPELLNRLAADYGILFRRAESGWAQCGAFHGPDLPLEPAEIFARGWENG